MTKLTEENKQRSARPTQEENQRRFLEKRYDQVGTLIAETDDPKKLDEIKARLKRIRANIDRHP